MTRAKPKCQRVSGLSFEAPLTACTVDPNSRVGAAFGLAVVACGGLTAPTSSAHADKRQAERRAHAIGPRDDKRPEMEQHSTCRAVANDWRAFARPSTMALATAGTFLIRGINVTTESDLADAIAVACEWQQSEPSGSPPDGNRRTNADALLAPMGNA